jgi:hypothetical protein
VSISGHRCRISLLKQADNRSSVFPVARRIPLVQRLNLTAPKGEASPATQTAPLATLPLNPAKQVEVTRRTKPIIASGLAPEFLFLCGNCDNLLTLPAGPGKKPIMLLFTTPFAARDSCV